MDSLFSFAIHDSITPLALLSITLKIHRAEQPETICYVPR